MIRKYCRLWTPVVLLLAIPAVCADAQDTLAIQGGRIIPVVGEEIENGVVLIEQGRIKAIGKDVEIPVEAKVIDASGKVVLPGLIDVHTSSPMSQSNEQNAVVPYCSVVDTIDPSRDYFRNARRNGMTTAGVLPGNSTLIGGQGAVIKTAGKYVNDMLVTRNLGMKISLQPSGTASRMSHFLKLRKELDKARETMEADKEGEAGDDEAGDDEAGDKEAGDKEAGDEEAGDEEAGDEEAGDEAKKDDVQDDDNADQLAAMRRLLRGELPAFVYCQNAIDVAQAGKLAEEYGLKIRLVVGRDSDKAVKQLAALKQPIVIDSQLVYWRTDEQTGDDEKIVIPRALHEQGVDFAFQITNSSSSSLGTNYLWYQAATAIKYGLPAEKALAAITILPAKILGVDEFVGSLEPGKDGDVIIMSGDPFDVTTWVDYTVVQGRVVYERSKDEQLKQLLKGDDSP